MSIPLIQKLLLVRKEFLIFVKNKIFCSCGKSFFPDLTEIENHLVEHERISRNNNENQNLVLNEKKLKECMKRISEENFEFGENKNYSEMKKIKIPEKTIFACFPECEINGGQVRDITCPECPEEELADFSELRDHFLDLHPDLWLGQSEIKNNSLIAESKEEVAKVNKPGWKVEYFCPIPFCKYHVLFESKKSHSNLKALRQHYTKVHARKSLKCDACGHEFQNSTLLKRHEKICGSEFKCETCEKSYKSFDTLQTHARRKNHVISRPDVIKKRLPKETNVVQNSASVGPDGLYRLTPRPSQLHLSAALALSELSRNEKKFVSKVDVGNQTDIDFAPSKGFKRSSSTITTQTHFGTRKRTAETQTGPKKKRANPWTKRTMKKIDTFEENVFEDQSKTTSTMATNTEYNLSSEKNEINNLLVCDKPLWTASTQTSPTRENNFPSDIFKDSLLDDPKSCLNITKAPKLGDIEQFSTETQTDFLGESLPESWKLNAESSADVGTTSSSLEQQEEDFSKLISHMDSETQFDLEDILCSNFTQTGGLESGGVLDSSGVDMENSNPGLLVNSIETQTTFSQFLEELQKNSKSEMETQTGDFSF